MTYFRHIKITHQEIHQHRRRRRLKRLAKILLQVVQYTLITAAALIMAFNGDYGQYVVAAYGLAVLLPKFWPFGYGKLRHFVASFDSQQVFVIALLILVTIPIFTLLGKTVIAENAAVYVFELLAIGVATAVIELWKDKEKHQESSSATSLPNTTALAEQVSANL